MRILFTLQVLVAALLMANIAGFYRSHMGVFVRPRRLVQSSNSNHTRPSQCLQEEKDILTKLDGVLADQVLCHANNEILMAKLDAQSADNVKLIAKLDAQSILLDGIEAEITKQKYRNAFKTVFEEVNEWLGLGYGAPNATVY